MVKKATIYDVARESGVSISTVSRVLNAPAKVNEGTRKSVLDAISRLSFVPRADAMARARQRMNRIAVITPFFTEASFVQRIRGVSQSLNPGEYELIIYTVKSLRQLEEHIDMICAGERVDAVIILSLNIPPDRIQVLQESGLPLVSVENSLPGFSSVAVDNHRGGYLGAGYLMKRGYTLLAFAGERSSHDFTLESTSQRLRGFLDALEATQTPRIEDFIYMGEIGDNSLIQWFSNLFSRAVHPQAVLCSSDLIAAKLIQTAGQLGKSIPRDIAILGFDNLDMAEYLNLSTVNQHLDYSGQLAGSMLKEILESKGDREKRTVFLDLEVVQRGTC